MAGLFSDDVDDVTTAIGRGEDVNAAGEGGIMPLHKACVAGNIDVVNLLLSKGANPNLEDKTPRQGTPLHYASDAYAADSEGDPKFEDVLRALVSAGAVCILDKKGKLPDVGEDADYMVQDLISKAEKAGVDARKDQKERRLAASRDLMNQKQEEYQNSCSAAMVAVMEAGSHEGYKGAMHL